MVKRTKSPRQIRNTTRWRKLSEYMRKRYPFCCDPFNKHTATLADDIHHIVPIAKDPELAFTKSNLAPLCRQCHAEVEAIEAKYGDTDFLFQGEGVDKSLAHNTSNPKCPASKKIRRFLGGGGLKLGLTCHDTQKARKGATGTIWCCRMKTFVVYYCGNCKQISSKLKNG